MDNSDKEGKGKEVEVKISISAENIRDVVASDDIPKIYANGFAIIQSNADAGLILQQLGMPVAVIYMSNILAKTLVKKLGASLLLYEEALDQEFVTTDDLDNAIEKIRGENK